ncbi:MAG: CAP domain-containing protein, partial [Cyanobacteria bacterium J06598_3]
EDMAAQNYFSHTGQDSSTPANRAIAADYSGSFVGENIAAGYPNALDVFQGWLNSSVHKDNILNANYTEIGIGFATNAAAQYDQYWTQVFGDRTSKSAAPSSAQPSDFLKNCTVSQPSQASASVKGWTSASRLSSSSPVKTTPAIVSTPEPKQMSGLLLAGLGLLFIKGRRK